MTRGELATGPALGSLATQVFILSSAILLCRADPEGPRVLRTAMASCLVLVALAAIFFVRLGGSIEVLAFALFTICVGSSLAFAWGWRAALVVVAVSLVACAMADAGAAPAGRTDRVPARGGDRGRGRDHDRRGVGAELPADLR